MAEILAFRRSRPNERRNARRARPGEVVIFPGIRVEYHARPGAGEGPVIEPGGLERQASQFGPSA